MTLENPGGYLQYKVKNRILELRREVWARVMGYGIFNKW